MLKMNVQWPNNIISSVYQLKLVDYQSFFNSQVPGPPEFLQNSLKNGQKRSGPEVVQIASNECTMA